MGAGAGVGTGIGVGIGIGKPSGPTSRSSPRTSEVPLSDLEYRIDTERAVDLFTMNLKVSGVVRVPFSFQIICSILTLFCRNVNSK